MSYLLDTNACIAYLSGRSETLRDRVHQVGDHQLVVCSVVYAELRYGAAKSRNPLETKAAQNQFLSRFASLPFDNAAPEHYGQIRAHLERQGKLIGPNDLLIATVCLANQCTLVTGNSAEFSRVPGLLWEDWQSPVDPDVA